MCNVLCRLSCLGALFSHCGRGGPQPVGDCFDLRLWSRGDVFTWPGRRKLKMIVGSTRERTRVGAEVKKKKKMWKKKEKRSSRKFFFGPSRDWPTSSNRWGHHFFLHFPSLLPNWRQRLLYTKANPSNLLEKNIASAALSGDGSVQFARWQHADLSLSAYLSLRNFSAIAHSKSSCTRSWLAAFILSSRTLWPKLANSTCQQLSNGSAERSA